MAEIDSCTQMMSIERQVLQAHQQGEGIPESNGHQVGPCHYAKAGRLHSATLPPQLATS
jgi:hypothetical protein